MNYESLDPNLDADIIAMLDERARTMLEFTSDHRPLKMYAIYRADLEMPAEKLAAQTGHAFLMSYNKAAAMRPAITSEYEGTGNGTKIVMYAKNLHQLKRGYRDALAAGLPCELIIDRGHVLLPHFTGKPIITGLGIGPVFEDEVKFLRNRFSMAGRKPASQPSEALIERQ